MADKPHASKSPKYQYAEKLKDPRWQKMRLQVFDRDKWKCRFCGNESNTLHAHHTYYESDSEGPWDYNPDTIITLCNECHEYEHEYMPGIRQSLLKDLSEAGFLITEDYMMLFDFLTEVKRDIKNKRLDREWTLMIDSHIRGIIGGDDNGQD